MRWLLLLIATSAWAVNPRALTSFDVVDDTNTATGTDILDLATIETGTDADVSARQCTASNFRCRLDTNGGSSSSRFAGYVDLASGERGGWEELPFFPVNYIEGTLAFAPHWPSGGGVNGEREVARWTMGAGGTKGCNVRLTSSRTFKLYWGSTLIGTAESLLNTNACSDNPLRGCSAGSDCVSTTCTTCSTTTGTGCFWPTVELVQANFPSATGDLVRCQVWIQGSLEIESGQISEGAVVMENLTGFEVGGPGTEAFTEVLGIDDVVVIPSTRAGNSYLHWMTPLNAVLTGGTVSVCGAGTDPARCVWDWGSAALNYRNFGATDNLIQGNVGKGYKITRFTPMPASIPAAATIPAVALPGIGRTVSSGTTWTTRTQLIQCADAAPIAGACESSTAPFDVAHGQQTTPLLTGFPVADAPPSNVGAWSIAQLGTLGMAWIAQLTPASNSLRSQAVGAVVQVRRSDGEPVVNLKDHNIGTNDGRTIVFAEGDSTGAGTGASTCQGGTFSSACGGTGAGAACNQETYCSWDCPNKSKPVGGCASNGDCQTCTLRRLEVNNGAGYRCTADADCNKGATCTSGSGNCGDGSGTCSADSDVTCGCNADCNLGTCATTATCDTSCPGGSCPARSGWPVYSTFVSDDYLNCSQDGWTTNLVLSQLTLALYGRQPTCKLIRGNIGKCTCASSAECQATSGGTCDFTGDNGRCSTSVWTTCTTSGDCPGGETCLGVCTASDNSRATCTGPKIGSSAANACASAEDCTGSGAPYACCTAADTGATCGTRVCAFGRPDYLIGGTGLNDMNPGEDTADCRRPYSPSGVCDACTETVCVADSTCSSISTASRCFGTLGQNAAGNGCWGPQNGEGGCTADTMQCRVTADCRSGQTCTGATGAPEPDGYCTCTADAHCYNNTLGDGFGYKCVNNICRLKCSVNAQCGATSGVCDGGTTSCQGQCSCPCDHTSCSVDADCPAWTVNVFGFWPIRTTAPKCTAGKCSQCGMIHCASTANQQAYQNGYFRYHTGNFWSTRYRSMNATINTEAARTSDTTKPLLIPMSFPDATAEYYPICKGGPWNDAKNASSRMRLQLKSEFPIWVDAAMAVNQVPDNLIYVDRVHPGAFGAEVWGRPAGTIMTALNSCRTGTGAESVIAKYCQNLDGTWDTGGAGYTICQTNPDPCVGTDTCRQRPCTVNNDTAAGCPGAPTCFLE